MCQTNRTRLWIAAMLALVCLSVGQATHYYPRLPDTVASHFGPAGQPDGWMSKGGFCVLGVAVPLAFTILFAGVTLVMQAVGRKLSPTPDSDESARRMLARRQMGESMISFMFGCGTATILLMMVIIQMAIQANLTPPPVLRHGWLVLSVYLIVLAPFVARVVIQYLRYERAWPSEPLPPEIWFPAKRFGWGWGLPCRWQGWVFMGGWLVGLGLGIVFILRWSLPALCIPFALVMAVVMIVVCALKGEKPRWRWGD
jgi:hypothetical protein